MGITGCDIVFCLHRVMVNSSDFHSGNTGSNPVGDILWKRGRAV